MKQGRQSIVWKILKNLDIVLAGLILGILVVVTFSGVIMRYIFNAPFVWQQEVQLTCFLWLSYLGVGVAFLTGSHVAVDIFVDSFPEKIKEIIGTMAYVITCLVLIYFLLQCNQLLIQMYETKKMTSILHVPYCAVYAVVPIGCVLMIVDYTVVTIRHWKTRRGKNE